MYCITKNYNVNENTQNIFFILWVKNHLKLFLEILQLFYTNSFLICFSATSEINTRKVVKSKVVNVNDVVHHFVYYYYYYNFFSRFVVNYLINVFREFSFRDNFNHFLYLIHFHYFYRLRNYAIV